MEKLNNEVTLEQLLRISVDQLNSIVVPISFMDEIAIPIKRVVNNLRVGIRAIETVGKKPEPEPEIEVVEARPFDEVVTEEENVNE